MSVISVSDPTLLQPSSPAPTAGSSGSTFWQRYLNQRRPEVQQLQDALKSGDLSAAEQAYNNLVALGNRVLHKDNPFLRPDRALDFNAIGGALQNGDLAGARQAFAALQETFEHWLPPAAGTTPAAALPATVVRLNTAAPESSSNLGNASSTAPARGLVNVVA